MKIKDVKNAGELYSFLDQGAEKIGWTVRLKAGRYMLDYDRNLKFHRDMSFIGEPGEPGKVVIDTSAMSGNNLKTDDGNRTGAIRMGNGYNSIEGVTIENHTDNGLRSLIQTDINLTPIAEVKVANCVLSGASIGLVIGNLNEANFRILKAHVYENEIFDNTIDKFQAGIFIQNRSNVNGIIDVLMERNSVYRNGTGLWTFNSATNGNISVISKGDKFYLNGIGISMMGGLNSPMGADDKDKSTYNKTVFQADGSAIFHNGGIDLGPEFNKVKGGVFATAGFVSGSGISDSVNSNSLDIVFKRSIIDQNRPYNDLLDYNVYRAFEDQSNRVGEHNSISLDISDPDNIIGQHRGDGRGAVDPRILNPDHSIALPS